MISGERMRIDACLSADMMAKFQIMIASVPRSAPAAVSVFDDIDRALEGGSQFLISNRKAALYVREISEALPTADRLLELTEGEIGRVLLLFIMAATDDPLRRFGATCDGIITELFSPPAGYDMRQQARRCSRRSRPSRTRFGKRVAIRQPKSASR